MAYYAHRPYVEENGPKNAANTMVCVVNQTNFLLDKLLRQLERSFLEQGGFTGRPCRLRKDSRQPPDSK